jgi:hypothetical protein
MKSVSKLLGGPFGSRMSRDVENARCAAVHEPAPRTRTEPGNGWLAREEIDGHKLSAVVVQKGAPGLSRWFPMTDDVLADTGLADVDAELE